MPDFKKQKQSKFDSEFTAVKQKASNCLIQVMTNLSDSQVSVNDSSGRKQKSHGNRLTSVWFTQVR